MLDLEPATRVLSSIVVGVSDEQLTGPTPCADTSLAAMLDHVDGFSLAFTAAATKVMPEGGSQPPSADAARLASDWRTRIPAQLASLAAAWRDPAAWTGMTQAGGIDLPGDVAGVIAINEVIVHSWDIAAASGQSCEHEAQLLEAAHGFVQATAERSPEGTPGLFGPPVPMPDDAPLFERLVALTGRSPDWHGGASGV